MPKNPLVAKVEEITKSTPVVIFMKGTPQFPQCGFSARAVQVLKAAGAQELKGVDVLSDDPRPIHLVCAGTKGKITSEDVLCAGAIIDRLLQEVGGRDEDLVDDQAQLALGAYVHATATEHGLRHALRNSFGGRNCRRLGFDLQIDRAAECDLFNIVPEYVSQRIVSSL